MNNKRKGLTATDSMLVEKISCNMELLALLSDGMIPVEVEFGKKEANVNNLQNLRMDIFKGDLVKINK